MNGWFQKWVYAGALAALLGLAACSGAGGGAIPILQPAGNTDINNGTVVGGDGFKRRAIEAEVTRACRRFERTYRHLVAGYRKDRWQRLRDSWADGLPSVLSVAGLDAEQAPFLHAFVQFSEVHRQLDLLFGTQSRCEAQIEVEKTVLFEGRPMIAIFDYTSRRIRLSYDAAFDLVTDGKAAIVRAVLGHSSPTPFSSTDKTSS